MLNYIAEISEELHYIQYCLELLNGSLNADLPTLQSNKPGDFSKIPKSIWRFSEKFEDISRSVVS